MPTTCFDIILYETLPLVYVYSCTTLQTLHQIIQLDQYVLSMAAQVMRVEWRFGIRASGTQCVMIPGVLLMQMLHASNLDTKRQHKPIREPVLTKDQVKLYWIIWIAL